MSRFTEELEFERKDAGLVVRPSEDGGAYIVEINGALVPARFYSFREAVGFATQGRPA